MRSGEMKKWKLENGQISKLLRSWKKQNHKQWGKRRAHILKGAGTGSSPGLWQIKIS